ncbi:uncharacterized protein [Battus philenor]|uniref:uncharacterized protein n=1 Tax=Battus philenor TaxID=42288 RepID=UPI0035CF2A1D
MENKDVVKEKESNEDIYPFNSSVQLCEELSSLNSTKELNERTSAPDTSAELKNETFATGSISKDSCATNSSNELRLSNTTDLITLKDVLSEIFSMCSGNFNVVHINAQSIFAHYLTLLATFAPPNYIDAILVSESFLKEDIDSESVDLPGYELIRNDRSHKGCGGVAIYLRKSINYNIVVQSPSRYTKSAEYLFIEPYYKDTKILLGVFYSPSSNIDYFECFDNILMNYRLKYQHVNILGDFNTDLLKNNKRRNKFLSIIDKHNLNILPLEETHFAPYSVASVLDVIIVSDKDNVTFRQIESYFSYHDIICVSNKLQLFERRDSMAKIETQGQINVVQPFWQTIQVRKALAQQFDGLKVYRKSYRNKEDLEEYQKSRQLIQLLEKYFRKNNKKSSKLVKQP